MGKGLSQRSVVEILDYLLFLVGNYDYLQSGISLGKEKVGRPGCFKQLLGFTTTAASPQFCKLSLFKHIYLFYFLFEGKNPLQNIFFFPSYFPSYHFTNIFPMASMSNQGASLLSSSFQCWFCSFVSLTKKGKSLFI